jgi:hypothetical protein
MVEGIVRSRTWGLMGERCDMEAQSFEKALDDWRRRVAEQKSMKPKVIERAVEKLKEL